MAEMNLNQVDDRSC